MKPLLRSAAGIDHRWRDNGDGTSAVVSSGDVAPILNQNKAMANENAGWSPSKDMRRVASIPLILVLKWLNEEGWNALDPQYEDRLRRKLNDPDYLYLRTAHWNL